MKLFKIAALSVLALSILLGASILLLVDALTVTEGELETTPDGIIYSDYSSPLSLFSQRCKSASGRQALKRIDFTHDRFRRGFLVYKPLHLNEHPALIVVLHGSGSTAQQTYDLLGDSFSEISERDGVVVLYAEGFGGGWNDLRTKSPHIAKKLDIDDVDYLKNIVDWAEQQLNVDRDKTFFLGMSNGAQMTMRVLVESPELVTAAAIIGGSLPKNPELYDKYDRLQPRPVMFVNGTADNVVPYQGGRVRVLKLFDFGEVVSVNDTVMRWVRAARLDNPPQIQHIDAEDDGTSIDLFRWTGPGKLEVRAYRVNGGQHSIPMPSMGDYCDDLLSTSHDMNTIEEAWSFFKAI